MNEHTCEACKGTSKVTAYQTRVVLGVKRTRVIRVECPNKLAEMMDTDKLKIRKADR